MQIKQTSKFIEVTVADIIRPSMSINHNSIYFDNDDEWKEEGITLFIKTILQYREFLGVNKLF